MTTKWITAGVAGALVLAGAVALATASYDPTPRTEPSNSSTGNHPCVIEYRTEAVHVSGSCDHTIILGAPSAEDEDATAPTPSGNGERRCDRNDESVCEQGDRVERHDCAQQAQHAQVTVQICNLELLEDANVNDAIDLIDENDFNETNLTLRDLLDATVNATLS